MQFHPLYAAGYHFQGSGARKINGIRTRLEWDINDYFNIEAAYQYDTVRHGVPYIGGTIRIPFGEKALKKLNPLERRMQQDIIRDIDIVVQTKETLRPTYREFIFAKAGANGDGTFESPADANDPEVIIKLLKSHPSHLYYDLESGKIMTAGETLTQLHTNLPSPIHHIPSAVQIEAIPFQLNEELTTEKDSQVELAAEKNHDEKEKDPLNKEEENHMIAVETHMKEEQDQLNKARAKVQDETQKEAMRKKKGDKAELKQDEESLRRREDEKSSTPSTLLRDERQKNITQISEALGSFERHPILSQPQRQRQSNKRPPSSIKNLRNNEKKRNEAQHEEAKKKLLEKEETKNSHSPQQPQEERGGHPPIPYFEELEQRVKKLEEKPFKPTGSSSNTSQDNLSPENQGNTSEKLFSEKTWNINEVEDLYGNEEEQQLEEEETQKKREEDERKRQEEVKSKQEQALESLPKKKIFHWMKQRGVEHVLCQLDRSLASQLPSSPSLKLETTSTAEDGAFESVEYIIDNETPPQHEQGTKHIVLTTSPLTNIMMDNTVDRLGKSGPLFNISYVDLSQLLSGNDLKENPTLLLQGFESLLKSECATSKTNPVFDLTNLTPSYAKELGAFIMRAYGTKVKVVGLPPSDTSPQPTSQKDSPYGPVTTMTSPPSSPYRGLNDLNSPPSTATD